MRTTTRREPCFMARARTSGGWSVLLSDEITISKHGIAVQRE